MYESDIIFKCLANRRTWVGGTCGSLLSTLAYLDWDAFPVARLNGDDASKRIRCEMKH